MVLQHVVSLISRGLVDVNEADPSGCTPLMRAADVGHYRVAKVLLEHGANPSVTRDDGFTALHLSAHNGHLAVAKMLIDKGRRPQRVGFFCPLHTASPCCEHGALEGPGSANKGGGQS